MSPGQSPDADRSLDPVSHRVLAYSYMAPNSVWEAPRAPSSESSLALIGNASAHYGRGEDVRPEPRHFR